MSFLVILRFHGRGHWITAPQPNLVCCLFLFIKFHWTTYSHARLFGFVLDAFTVQQQSWTTARESTKTNIITIWLIIEKREVLCSMVLLDWCKSNCGFALLNFAVWYWNTFLNTCGHVIHHFNAHFLLFFFLLMTYYLLCILYLFEAIEDKKQIQTIF